MGSGEEPLFSLIDPSDDFRYTGRGDPTLTMARFVIAALTLVALMLSPQSPLTAAPAEHGDKQNLLESIDSLRAGDRYPEAVATARKLIEAIRADTCSYQNEIGDAKRLIATLEDIGRMGDEARAQLGLAVRLAADCARRAEEGDYEGAAGLAERQLEITRRYLGSAHYETAMRLRDLGYFLNELGETERAERLFLESLDVERRLLGDHPNVANTLNHLAGLNLERNDYPAAERLYREALDVLDRSVGQTYPDVAMVYSNLAVLSKRKHDFASAEAFYRRALVIYRYCDRAACTAGNFTIDIAWTLRMLGALFVARGSYELAEPILQETAEIFRISGDRTDLALTMMDLAGIYQDREFLGPAESLYRQALALLQDSISLVPGMPRDENEFVSAALNNLGDLEHDMSNYATADSLYEQALRVKMLVLPATHQDAAVILLNRARNFRDWGKYESALPLYEKARAILRERLGADHPNLSRCEFSLANLYFAKGEYASAEALFLDAARIYELTRSHIGSGMGRLTFQNNPYPKLAATYLSTNKAKESWPALERYLGRYLGDLLSITDTRELSSAERAREDSLKNTVGELESTLIALREEEGRGEPAAALEQIDEARLRLQSAEAALASCEREIASKYPMSEGLPYTLERVQSAIGGNAAIVGWLDVEATKGSCRSWAYVIKRTGPVSWVPIGSHADARTECGSRRAEEFRNAVTKPQVLGRRAADLGHELWRTRLAPLASTLSGISHLVIIPSGPMLGIPVEALVDTTGAPLGDRFSISYAPSATVYAWLVESSRGRPTGGPVSALLCGDPVFGVSGNWQTLPGTREEINAISARAPRSLTLLGMDASEQRLHHLAAVDTLRNFRILHFATHAFVDDEYPERCALILTQVNLPDPLECVRRGDRIFDGLADAGEILREWKLDADLVTLSACETGTGKSVPGEGYIGFSHAFFRTGALSIIVSLWKADDRATALLMERFYQNYFGHGGETLAATHRMSKVEALREAKQWLRNYRDSAGETPYGHPFYWANFILIGDPGETR
jgi:CHAT domain-containing protein/tetratricopeptide (TPR) repeat protein